MTKRILISAAVGLALAVAIAFLTLREPATYHGTHFSPGMPAADFTLESADGPVSKTDFEGKAVAIFFGFTACPDICPTTLLRLSNALDRLGEKRSQVQVVFISVDPERDTPERADRYAESVDPAFVGLSGTPEEIADVAAEYGIYYEKAEGSEATGYLVDHLATITVLNEHGRCCVPRWSASCRPITGWLPARGGRLPARGWRLAVLSAGAVVLAACGDGPGEAARTDPGTGAGASVGVVAPWVRVSIGPEEKGAPANTAAYFVLTNPTDTADALVAVETAIADTAEIHSVTMEDGIMRMRAVDSVGLPAGGEAVLEQGGYHVMLIGVPGPLAEGDSVDLRLRLRSGRVIDVTAPVLRSPPQM